MKILYGVVGEGMGHATRSRVVIEHLLSQGHELKVVVSGRAHGLLSRAFAGRDRIDIDEIHGLFMRYEGNALDVGRSVLANLGQAPVGLARNIAAYVRLGFDPDAIVSDFESWAFFYGLNHDKPVISIDNMQVINRCEHPDEITRDPDFQLAKAAVKVKIPGAHHYIVTTFFRPPVRKERTTLVPPILRPEILAARREPGKHVLVYQTATANDELVPLLQSLPYEFRLYGMRREEVLGNVILRDFSETGFVDDLRTARAVIAGGGFSLMGEAVHLRVPMYSVPIEGHYEQILNARYLAMLGYGRHAESFDRDAIADFIETAPSDTGYQPRDNSELFHAVDGCLAGI
ncbi:MAG: teichoic acid biosynthesis protein [Deltaproteobacteria bacterium]|nr:teichoic acid biosynthesis protein [Deltaproteobacteria bacterium]